MSLQPKRLAEEGVPVAAILLCWNVLAVVAGGFPDVSSALFRAGVVMAGLYVAVRGATLASDAAALDTGNVESLLAENARVALASGVWFLGGAVAGGVHQSYVRSEVVDALGSALAGAGLGVVALYAVAVGVATIGGPSDVSGRTDPADSDGESPAGD